MSDQSYIVELTFTDYFFEQFKEVFDIEVEILQGDHRILDDGRHYCKIEISGYKVAMFKDFERAIISIPSNDVKVTFMGQPINKN